MDQRRAAAIEKVLEASQHRRAKSDDLRLQSRELRLLSLSLRRPVRGLRRWYCGAVYGMAVPADALPLALPKEVPPPKAVVPTVCDGTLVIHRDFSSFCTTTACESTRLSDDPGNLVHHRFMTCATYFGDSCPTCRH